MARTDPRPHYGRKRRIRDDGYIDVWEPTHPIARRDGYVFEHRKNAWDAGLLTDASLEVHHRNQDPGDNRIANLEVVEGAEHTRRHGLKGAALQHTRKTHCPHGHPYDEANTYVNKGVRYCRECVRKRTREYHKKRRAAA